MSKFFLMEAHDISLKISKYQLFPNEKNCFASSKYGQLTKLNKMYEFST